MSAILKLKSDGAQALLTVVLLVGSAVNALLVWSYADRAGRAAPDIVLTSNVLTSNPSTDVAPAKAASARRDGVEPASGPFAAGAQDTATARRGSKPGFQRPS